jgi:hypothetical protein
VSEPLPATDVRAESESTDSLVLEGVLWRAYRRLFPHWLHAVRGSLNAMSLNLAVLQVRTASAERRPIESIRAQIRDLAALLNTLLDGGFDHDRTAGTCQVVKEVTVLQALVAPLASHRQVMMCLQTPGADAEVLARVDASILHAVLLPALVDAVDSMPGSSVLTLQVSPPVEQQIRVTIETGTAVRPEATGLVLADVAARALRRWNGGFTWLGADAVCVVTLERA